MDFWAVDKLIDWAAGKDGNEKIKRELRTDIDKLSADLAGPSPTAAEHVLAQTAAVCWFAYRLHEGQYADSVKSGSGMSIAQSEHAQRRIDRAHRRMLASLKTLATVRRLAVPAVQINVARRQVNQINSGGIVMKFADGHSIMLAIRAMLDSDDGEEKAQRLVEYVIDRATDGHLGFFKLVLDLVDGKLHKTAGSECTFESNGPVIVADNERDTATVKAA
jgi:hypothetical protein